MDAAAASTEIYILGWSVVLLLAQIVLQSGTAGDLGAAYRAGPRDEQKQSRNLLSGRFDRALRNFLETYPAFVALALTLAVTGKTGGLGATGAWIYILARVAYVPIYAAGIAYVRTIVWLVSIVGLVLMIIRLMA